MLPLAVCIGQCRYRVTKQRTRLSKTVKLPFAVSVGHTIDYKAMDTNTSNKVIVGSDILRKENETLVVTRSAKTGAGSISIERQKTWVDRFMKNDKTGVTRNAVKKLYAEYRTEHAKEFTERIASQMLKGNLLVHRASLSKSSAVRGVSFITPREAAKIKVNDAAIAFGAAHKLDAEQVAEIVRLARQKSAENEANAPVEVHATEVKTDGQAVASAA